MPTVPFIDTLPTPPSTSSPTDFDARADAFLGALPSFQAQANAVAGAMNDLAAIAIPAAVAALSATGYVCDSTTSFSVGTGSKAFTTQSGKSFVAGDAVVARRRGSAAVRMIGAVTGYSGTTLTINVTSVLGSGGPFTDWIIYLAALVPDDTTGRHAIWIPAAAMNGRITNGPGAALTETTTNKILRRTLDFDASAIEYAQFAYRMPKSWDEGTVTFAPVWSHASTTTNFKVSWGLQAVAISDGDAGDAAFGTAQYSNDTGGTTDNNYIGPESAAVTVAGSPAAEDLVVYQFLRKADDATNDTLAIDARLHGVMLYINTNAGTDL